VRFACAAAAFFPQEASPAPRAARARTRSGPPGLMSCRYRPVAPQEQIKIVHMPDLVRQASDQQERIRALPVRLKKTLPDELSTKDFRGEPQTIVSITLTHRGAAGEFTAPGRAHSDGKRAVLLG